MLLCKNDQLYAFQVPAKYTAKFQKWILEISFSPQSSTVKQSRRPNGPLLILQLKFHVAAFVVVVLALCLLLYN